VGFKIFSAKAAYSAAVDVVKHDISNIERSYYKSEKEMTIYQPGTWQVYLDKTITLQVGNESLTHETRDLEFSPSRSYTREELRDMARLYLKENFGTDGSTNIFEHTIIVAPERCESSWHRGMSCFQPTSTVVYSKYYLSREDHGEAWSWKKVHQEKCVMHCKDIHNCRCASIHYTLYPIRQLYCFLYVYTENSTEKLTPNQMFDSIVFSEDGLCLP